MARRAKKQEEYQPSGDIQRIISLGNGKYAYLIDEKGKLNHMSTDDPDFVARCFEINEKLDGRIVRQLQAMGWDHFAEAVLQYENNKGDE